MQIDKTLLVTFRLCLSLILLSGLGQTIATVIAQTPKSTTAKNSVQLDPLTGKSIICKGTALPPGFAI